jgi:lipopolysaccharide export LptBFGC system permease protein LptF
MAVLRKVSSATLVEVLVATVLVVILFMIASLILNNLILNTYKQNTHAIETRLNRLEYSIHHQTIELPYEEKFGDWQIDIETIKRDSKTLVILKATNENGKKEMYRGVIKDIDADTSFK